jgi:hypothetical protein
MEGKTGFAQVTSLEILIKVSIIVKQCFWIEIKFITHNSGAIHTIITTR